MLIEEDIKVKITARNRKHYQEMGYKDIDEIKTIYVKSSHLSRGSSKRVKVKCDYCGEIVDKRYADYIKNKEESHGEKDACNDCKVEKTKDTNLKLYGTESVLSLDSIQEKAKNTLIERYGVANPMHSDKLKEKIKRTNLKKYGVENPFQNKEVQERQRETVRELYGVDNVFQNEDVKTKIKETMLERYGVTNPMKNTEIAKRSMENSFKAMVKNGSQVCSSQQRHIHSILGGELNYGFDLVWLDIAYPESKIYLEYDGSGHDIGVLYKKMSRKEFDLKEIRRYKFLKSKGWKQILIISREDKLPEDNVILSLKEYAFNILKNTSSNWVEYDIDNETIRYKDKIIACDFTEELV